jgi:hypothetical protein
LSITFTVSNLLEQSLLEGNTSSCISLLHQQVTPASDAYARLSHLISFQAINYRCTLQTQLSLTFFHPDETVVSEQRLNTDIFITFTVEPIRVPFFHITTFRWNI